jgi:hypothetical protein
LTMARGATSPEVDEKLRYMPLANFVAAKGRRNTDPKYALRRFNLICGSDVFPQSLLQDGDFDDYKSNADRPKFDAIKPADEIKKDAIASAKKSLESVLEKKKRELLSALKERRELLRQKKKEEIERREQVAREQKKAQQAKEAISQGLDLSQLDFGKNFKSVEPTLIKAVETYAQQIHGVNNLSKIEPPFLSRPEDITTVVEAIIKLQQILPSNETQEKKMKPRFDKYTKWLGEDAVQELRQQLTR